MSLTDKELELAKADHAKLGGEIAYLKQCQVKLIEIALIIVGSYAAVLGIRSGEPKVDGVSIIMGCFVVYTLPVFGWLILHKSGSAFRAIAWSKIIEGFLTERSELSELRYIGYETCYQRVRLLRWLEDEQRISGFGDLENVQGGEASVQEQATRIGRYYREIIRILACLAVIVIAAMAVVAWALRNNGHLWYAAAGLAAALAMAIYTRVKFRRLLDKTCVRIERFPWSIQAWYVMFLQVMAKEAGIVLRLP